MSLSILVALSLQILFLFTILKCMLAKWVDFQINAASTKLGLWYSGLRCIFFFSSIFYHQYRLFANKSVPGDYIC